MANKAKGRKGRLGRNKHRIAAYYNSGRNLWNHARRIVHHLRRQSDAQAHKKLREIMAPMSLSMQQRFERMYWPRVTLTSITSL